MHRAERLVGHVRVEGLAAGYKNQHANQEQSAANAESNLKWNGWGYKDSEFELDKEGQVMLTGTRYLFSGKQLPNLRAWMEEMAGLDINNETPSQPECPVPPQTRNEAFLAAVQGHCKHIRHDDADRLFHAHGHTCQEIFALRFGKFKRVPDAVIYPGSHEQVEAIVKAAGAHNVVLIPFGGGTNVSHALIPPEEEKRMIVSVDMKEMSRIKWISRKNMLACIEAGAVGKDIEQHLRRYNLVLGHEPDSAEFSTLGGWVATRASGMRKNRYGNIEDIVVKIKMVSPIGTFEKTVSAPRVSTGPDLHHVIMGSEGLFGIVTECIVRLRPVPECTRYGSIIFPNFESGVECLYDVAIARLQPVSIRLVDNMQFQFGQALKPGAGNWKKALIDKAKKWYVLNHLKFEANTMVAATLLFEGTKKEVDIQEKAIYALAKKHGGMPAGEENGIRGYFLTYMIAYLRDFGMQYGFIAESFETSIPHDSVLVLCNNVKEAIFKACEKEGVVSKPFVSCRVTQLYDTGACIYFYFGFLWEGLADPMATFAYVEHEAREEILKLGGSLSHHHGVGKLRKEFFPGVVGNTSINLLKGLKSVVDPNNVFANGNLGI